MKHIKTFDKLNESININESDVVKDLMDAINKLSDDEKSDISDSWAGEDGQPIEIEGALAGPIWGGISLKHDAARVKKNIYTVGKNKGLSQAEVDDILSQMLRQVK